MKLNTKRILALVALGTLVTLTPNTLAQATPKEGNRPNRPAAQAGARRDRLETMATELKLTEEQKNQLRPILKEEADKMKALRDDTALSAQDRRAKNREIRESINGKIKKVLTTEQWDQWQKQQAERRARPAQKPPTPQK
jgi:Spy/CpxP family protein refolding chaperone